MGGGGGIATSSARSSSLGSISNRKDSSRYNLHGYPGGGATSGPNSINRARTVLTNRLDANKAAGVAILGGGQMVNSRCKGKRICTVSDMSSQH